MIQLGARKVGRPYMPPVDINRGGQMCKLLRSFVSDQSGATAIEYGLIAAGISVAIIVVVQGLGTKLNTVFSNITSKLN